MDGWPCYPKQKNAFLSSHFLTHICSSVVITPIHLTSDFMEGMVYISEFDKCQTLFNAC